MIDLLTKLAIFSFSRLVGSVSMQAKWSDVL